MRYVRRVLFLCIAGVSLDSACSSRGGSTTAKPPPTFESGNYLLSSLNESNSCGGGGGGLFTDVFVEPDGRMWIGYLNVSHVPGTISGRNFAASLSGIGGAMDGGYFCEIWEQLSISGTVTASDEADVTEDWTFTDHHGSECSTAFPSLPLPCAIHSTYHVRRVGAPQSTLEAWTSTSATGVFSATSDVAPLTMHNPNGSGQSLAMTISLKSQQNVTLPSWSCQKMKPDPSLPERYLLTGVDGVTQSGVFLVVASSAWTVGSHPIDGESVIADIFDSPSFVVSTSGTLVIDSAGTAVDTPGSNCRFHIADAPVVGVGAK